MSDSLLDRAGLMQALSERLGEQPLTLALIDLDSFKEINDDYGHAVGDEVLAGFARLLAGSLPDGVIAARIGGDEFAAGFIDTPAESALIVLEEIRAHFSSRPAAEGVSRRADLSAGIATLPTHARDLDALFKAADEALWRAKSEGKGRLAIYVESKMQLKSNYYTRAGLERLAKLSATLGRTEASLLREALDDLLQKYRDEL